MWRGTVAAARNLFRRGHSPDVRSTVLSVYFRTIETDIKHKWKILASLFQGRSWSIQHHSDCATRAERIKRFVNVYLHCIISNLKKKQHVDLAPPWKNSCGRPWKRGLFFEVLSKQSVKTRWWVFFLHNADFVKFRNASELSWQKVLLIRVLYREKVMRHGWSATVTCLAFIAFLHFLTDLWCCESLSEGAKTEIRNSCEKSV